MNVDNMKKLADHLRTTVPPKTFDMGTFMNVPEDFVESDGRLSSVRTESLRELRGFKCGTAACIAGHALLLLGTDEQVAMAINRGSVDRVAEELLGLTRYQADNLFYNFSIQTPQDAADFLDSLVAARETGE